MLTQKTNSLPKVQAETGFSLGFFCGAILGAIGVYLVATPEGKVLKKMIVSEFEKHQQNLIVESFTETDKKETPLFTTIHRAIHKLKELVKETKISPEIKSPPKAAGSKKKHIFKKK